MCNCGRANASRPQFGPAASAESTRKGRTPALQPDVVLRFVGAAALLLRGPVSRRVYALRTDARLMAVDAADVAPLLRSALFETVPPRT